MPPNAALRYAEELQPVEFRLRGRAHPRGSFRRALRKALGGAPYLLRSLQDQATARAGNLHFQAAGDRHGSREGAGRRHLPLRPAAFPGSAEAA